MSRRAIEEKGTHQLDLELVNRVDSLCAVNCVLLRLFCEAWGSEEVRQDEPVRRTTRMRTGARKGRRTQRKRPEDLVNELVLELIPPGGQVTRADGVGEVLGESALDDVVKLLLDLLERCERRVEGAWRRRRTEMRALVVGRLVLALARLLLAPADGHRRRG
jgi:hypothetical protein